MPRGSAFASPDDDNPASTSAMMREKKVLKHGRGKHKRKKDRKMKGRY